MNQLRAVLVVGVVEEEGAGIPIGQTFNKYLNGHGASANISADWSNASQASSRNARLNVLQRMAGIGCSNQGNCFTHIDDLVKTQQIITTMMVDSHLRATD